MKTANETPSNPLVAYVLLTIMVAFLIIVALSIQGCTYSIPKNIAKIEQKNAAYLPQYCANRFPIKELVKDSLVYLKGETEYIYDSTSLDVDSLINSVELRMMKTNGKRLIRVPCPPCPISVDTFLHYKQTTQESTASLAALQANLNTETANLAKSKQETENWKQRYDGIKHYAMWFWFTWVGIVALVVFKAWVRFKA